MTYANIKFNRAAFNHKLTEADILRAFETFIYEDPVEDAENKYLLLGFNLNGNLIEVMYNEIDEDSINVFHANLNFVRSYDRTIQSNMNFVHNMPCRREYREMID